MALLLYPNRFTTIFATYICLRVETGVYSCEQTMVAKSVSKETVMLVYTLYCGYWDLQYVYRVV